MTPVEKAMIEKAMIEKQKKAAELTREVRNGSRDVKAKRDLIERDIRFQRGRETRWPTAVEPQYLRSVKDTELKQTAETQEKTAEGLTLRELTEEDRQKLRDIGMTSANIEKCRIDENGVYHLECRRSYLEGQHHPETGVPYSRRQIEIDGVQIEGVFPEFDSVVEYNLPEGLRFKTANEQFNYLNEELRKQIQSDPELRAKFTEQQIQMIESGKNPAGYTWHHNESCGRMQLVETSKHALSGHTGGDSIWCKR